MSDEHNMCNDNIIDAIIYNIVEACSDLEKKGMCVGSDGEFITISYKLTDWRAWLRILWWPAQVDDTWVAYCNGACIEHKFPKRCWVFYCSTDNNHLRIHCYVNDSSLLINLLSPDTDIVQLSKEFIAKCI